MYAVCMKKEINIERGASKWLIPELLLDAAVRQLRGGDDEKQEQATYVEGNDDTGGVIVGQLDGITEESMVVSRL